MKSSSSSSSNSNVLTSNSLALDTDNESRNHICHMSESTSTAMHMESDDNASKLASLWKDLDAVPALKREIQELSKLKLRLPLSFPNFQTLQRACYFLLGGEHGRTSIECNGKIAGVKSQSMLTFHCVVLIPYDKILFFMYYFMDI
jgi:hypothetical protein